MNVNLKHLSLFVLLFIFIAGGSFQQSAFAKSSPVDLHALPGIAFQPPIGESEKLTGDFDPDVALGIEIFELAGGQAVGPALGPSFSTLGAGKLKIKVSNDPGIEEQYHVNWETSDSNQPDDTLLRVELRLLNAPANTSVCDQGLDNTAGCLAYFDVLLRKSMSAAKKDPAPDGVLDLVNGQTLPIKVHIALGSLTPGPDSQQLPGNAGDPATAAIPELDFIFRAEDYTDDHPELGGLMVSFNTLYLVFTLDTTVAEANAILAAISAEIVGGRPGAAGQIEGVLLLRLPTTTHSEIIAVLEQLRANPKVKFAVQDSLLEPVTIPNSNGGSPPDWTWEVSPIGGNWGLELIRVPQMWNFNEVITKQGASTITGVHDIGFASTHADLNYLQSFSSTEHKHGTHVAGTIGATFNNGTGIDGINPFSQLVTNDSSAFAVNTGFGLIDFILARNDMKVVNVSLGNNWYQKSPPISPNNNIFAQQLVSNQGQTFQQLQQLTLFLGEPLPFILAAAGNDSGLKDLDNNGSFEINPGDVDAKWSSPMNYAALVLGSENIMVVEAVNLSAGTGGAVRAGFSNINGHISAPGQAILSTSFPLPYEYLSGTSMAAPHVTGLVSYLLSLELTLSHAEIRQLLMDNSVDVDGNASHRIDAFATAMDIDRIRGNTNVLMKLVDIDDGSLDGNQRIVPCDGGGCAEYIDRDADGDGGIGDGAIDMSDFRIWRDWLLQIENDVDLKLDGSAGHPKKDVNGNGIVEAAAQENIFPKGDFNGDGILDQNAKNKVPGVFNAEVTDLDVLSKLFNDPYYQAADLPNLIDSADLEIDAQKCLSQPGVVEVRSTLYDFDILSTDVVGERVHTSDEQRHIYTASINSSDYFVDLKALDSGGKVIGVAQKSFHFELGGDAYYNPECGRIDLEPEVLEVSLLVDESTIETVKLVSTELEANYELFNDTEHVQTGTTEGTVQQNGEETLELIITCPAEVGDYPQTLDLTFADDDGIPFQDAVPEVIAIELHCLEDLVVATPDPLTLSAEVNQSTSSGFSLLNFGTALNYEAAAADFVTLTNNAAGVLAQDGEAAISLSALCPSAPGSYSSIVNLSFSDDGGNGLTEGVPSSIEVQLTCLAPVLTIRVDHERYQTVVNFPRFRPLETFTDRVSETYISPYASSGAALINYSQSIAGVTTIINTPFPLFGLPMNLNMSNGLATNHQYPCDSAVHDWSGNGNSSMDILSTGDIDSVIFDGTLNIGASEDHNIPEHCQGLIEGGLQSTSSLLIDFTLLKRSSVSATWTCGDVFRDPTGSDPTGPIFLVKTINDNQFISYVFTASTVGCTYQGELAAGTYRFSAQLEVRTDDRSVNEPLAVNRSGSYHLEFSPITP